MFPKLVRTGAPSRVNALEAKDLEECHALGERPELPILVSAMTLLARAGAARNPLAQPSSLFEAERRRRRGPWGKGQRSFACLERPTP